MLGYLLVIQTLHVGPLAIFKGKPHSPAGLLIGLKGTGRLRYIPRTPCCDISLVHPLERVIPSSDWLASSLDVIVCSRTA
jgi:hypothetical protein